MSDERTHDPQCQASTENGDLDDHECFRYAGHPHGHVCRRCGHVWAPAAVSAQEGPP